MQEEQMKTEFWLEQERVFDDHTSSSSSSDTAAPGYKTELGVPTWAPKQPADGCFFERTYEHSSGVDFVVEFHWTLDEDGNRNRTAWEFHRLRSEVFGDKILELRDTRIVGGWFRSFQQFFLILHIYRLFNRTGMYTCFDKYTITSRTVPGARRRTHGGRGGIVTFALPLCSPDSCVEAPSWVLLPDERSHLSREAACEWSQRRGGDM
jgi:hypothetical protein